MHWHEGSLVEKLNRKNQVSVLLERTELVRTQQRHLLAATVLRSFLTVIISLFLSLIRARHRLVHLR